MPAHKPLPSIDILRAILRYNPHTGEFYRFRKSKKAFVKMSPTRAISIKGSPYMAHRLAYLLHHGIDPGALMVDHINGDDSDNRITNLRMVTASQNSMNRKSHARSGHKGVYLMPSGHYSVQVCRTQGRGEVGVKGSRDGWYRKTRHLFTSRCLKDCKAVYIDWVYSAGLEQFCRPADLEPVTDCSCATCKKPVVALPDNPNDLKPGDCWLNDMLMGGAK
jgi:hypothetical protein